MVSFGGAAADNGDELAQRISDVNALERAYQSVVDTYGLSQIDLDIEGNAVQDHASVDLRSQAIAQLQGAEAAQGRNLQVWLTLPATPTGLDSDGAYAVNSAINAGITNLGVNLMTMDYGSDASPDQMASYAEQAAMSVSQQFSISPSNIGVTPMIGVNDAPDSSGETFDLTSASTVASWAQNWGLGRISMWSIDRDHPYGDPITRYGQRYLTARLPVLTNLPQRRRWDQPRHRRPGAQSGPIDYLAQRPVRPDVSD